jgi:hypothetical protein
MDEADFIATQVIAFQLQHLPLPPSKKIGPLRLQKRIHPAALTLLIAARVGTDEFITVIQPQFCAYQLSLD